MHLGKPDTQQTERGRGGADSKLVRIHEDGNQVAEKSAEQVQNHELSGSQLFLDAEAHPALEEQVEEDVESVGVQHHGCDQTPHFSARDTRAPARAQQVQRTRVRRQRELGAHQPGRRRRRNTAHGEEQRPHVLHDLKHADALQESVALEIGKQRGRDRRLGGVLACLLCLGGSAGTHEKGSAWRRHLARRGCAEEPFSVQ
mmetsp:Transcript_27822/g.70294  ORF Transcript_27822/g.70294 Transcript_27822/m.70294 type:complete len:201 (-) Transcript_27822:460-1062(-)